jgi:hypothetical protein
MDDLRWLRQRWNQYWFEASGPSNLGLCRIVFFGTMVVLYLGINSGLWATVPDVFWMPITVFDALSLPVLPREALWWLDRIWLLSLALSCVGLLTRSSTLVAFLVGAYLLGLPHNFGKTHHSDAILLLTLGVMALSRCGDAWSLDQIIRRRRGTADATRRTPRTSGEYTWPVRLIWALMAVVFFSAGVSKLRHSGLDWIFSSNLHFQLLRHRYSHVALSGLAPLVAHSVAFTKVMAAGSVALELSAPLALFSRRLRLLIVPGLLLLQAGIWALMGVSFTQYLAVYIFWVPWDRLVDRLAPRLREEHGLAVADEGA